MEKKLFNKKTGNVTFLVKIDFSICPNTCEFFQIFVEFFKTPFIEKCFSKNPETSWVQCVVFLRKYIQISWLDRFLKLKKNSKTRKKSEKIHMYSDKLTNRFRLKKVRLPIYFQNNFFFTNFSPLGSIRNTLWVLLFAGNITIRPP